MGKLSGDERTKVLKRIKKMLALAGNNPSAEEAATAAAMAEKLMRKYDLEHAEVIMQELTEDTIVAHETGVAYARDVPPWVGRIIVATAQLHDCEARYDTSYREDKKSPYIGTTFLGEKSDVIVATWVFEYLLAELKRLGLTYSKQIGGATNVQRYSFRKACAGEISQTLRRMLREKENDMANHSTGTALVLRKRDLVRSKFTVNYSTNSKRQHYGDAQAAYAGQEAGRKVSIRTGIESETKSQRRIG